MHMQLIKESENLQEESADNNDYQAKKKHQNRNAVDAVHHAQVEIDMPTAAVFLKNTQKIA